MAKTLSERLRIARKRAGITQVKLAEKLGITYPTVNRYERGHRIPDAALLARIAEIVDCDPGWLLSGQGDINDPKAETVGRVPLLYKIPEEFPEKVSEEISGYIRLPDTPRDGYAIVVDDDAMSPGIKTGDYAIFVQSEARNGDIVVVRDEWGDVIIRRFRKKKGEEFLVADNPDYRPIKMSDKFTILGKVVTIWRKISV